MKQHYFVPVRGYNGQPWAMFMVLAEDKVHAISVASREVRGHKYHSIWAPHTECPSVEYMDMLAARKDARR